MNSFFSELKRRNVYKVALVLIGGGHELEFSFEEVKAWSRTIVPERSIEGEIALPGKAAEDNALFGISPIREDFVPEQFGKLLQLRLSAQ
jgi:hypothetical protein